MDMELYLKWQAAEKQYCRTLDPEDRKIAVQLYARVEEDRAARRPIYKPWKNIKNYMRRVG